jgi:hypothetical protein
MDFYDVVPNCPYELKLKSFKYYELSIILSLDVTYIISYLNKKHPKAKVLVKKSLILYV